MIFFFGFYLRRGKIRQHKESVLEDDPNLPEQMKPRAESIYEKFLKPCNKGT